MRSLRTLVVIATILLLPTLASHSNVTPGSAQPSPFASVAYAGHTMNGGIYCECPGSQFHTVYSVAPGAEGGSDSATDQTTESLILALFLTAVWLRLRS